MDFFEKKSSGQILPSGPLSEASQFAITIHQFADGFTPSPVETQYVIQGMWGRRLVAEDESTVEAPKSNNASQPVNL